MPQILFRLPIGPSGIPVYTFGCILFVVWLFAFWLGGLLARRAGVNKGTYQNWTICATVLGMVGYFLIRGL